MKPFPSLHIIPLAVDIEITNWIKFQNKIWFTWTNLGSTLCDSNLRFYFSSAFMSADIQNLGKFLFIRNTLLVKYSEIMTISYLYQEKDWENKGNKNTIKNNDRIQIRKVLGMTLMLTRNDLNARQLSFTHLFSLVGGDLGAVMPELYGRDLAFIQSFQVGLKIKTKCVKV